MLWAIGETPMRVKQKELFVDPSVEIDHIEDSILRIIKQYKNHPSVVAISEKNWIHSFPLSIYQSQI